MSRIGEELIAYWRSQNMALQSGASEDQIEAFELRYQVRLPFDLRDYYLQINGMDIHWPHAQDRNGFSFWPLEKVKTVPEEARSHTNGWSHFLGAEHHFIFADYLDWSWAYAIHLSPEVSHDNPVSLIGKPEAPIKIANSFSDFIGLYLVDSPQLYGING